MRVWVLHRGALGDGVLLWPRLRHLVRSGHEVTLVSEGAKAQLAAQEVGARACDIERPMLTALWQPGAAQTVIPEVGLVLNLLAEGTSPAGAVVRDNLARMFPGAQVESIPPPVGGAVGRRFVEQHPLAAVPRRWNPQGPVVVHVGAGAEAKRWPMERWSEQIGVLRRTHEVVVLAGEVEAERLSVADRRALSAAGGRICVDLAELRSELAGARVFVGADSGPTHLAAQLGVATVAMFGPTDPGVWAPVGPAVRVLAPPRPEPMGWLQIRTVGAVVDEFAAWPHAGE